MSLALPVWASSNLVNDDSTNLEFRTPTGENTNKPPRKPSFIPVSGYYNNGEIYLCSLQEGEAEISVYSFYGDMIYYDVSDLSQGITIILSESFDPVKILVTQNNMDYIAIIGD